METTLVPFATLPACATSCGPLYDANGGCVPTVVPTAAPSVYAACFCSHSKVIAFSTASTGVCDGQCDAAGLSGIRDWFTNFCANPATFTGLPANEAAPAPSTTQGGTGGTSSPTNTKVVNPIASDTSGGDWISTHWQWVVFLVIMVVAIVGIWVGACLWRRRYLRRKDRQYALGKRMSGLAASRNAAAAGSRASVMTPAVGGGGPNASTRSVHIPAAGMFVPAPISSAGIYGPETEREKRSRNKWNPTART